MSLDQQINKSANERHYDYIADAWQYLLGDNFHWGYFETPRQTLESATEVLIDKMVSRVDLKSASMMLDVGCGIGGPARYLTRKYGCKITGFSTSEEGIVRARHLASDAGFDDNLTFEVRDALDNKFDSKSFDVVMLLEMSHLIRDKTRLIAESCRPLKAGGTVTLCDLTLQRKLTAREIVDRYDDLQLLERCFGKARLEPLTYYNDVFARCGLENIQSIDISQQVIPTIEKWRNNAENNRKVLVKHVSDKDVDDFIRSCDILDGLYRSDIWGYCLISGQKTGRDNVGVDDEFDRALF